MPTRRSSVTRLAKAAVLGVLALATVPAAASAAACPDIPSSRVFASFGDTNDYFLAPGGDFEGSLQWTGRDIDRGNVDKPWSLAGGKGLRLDEGETATSPAFCVSEQHPHLRFMTTGENGSARLKVEAIENGITTALVVLNGGQGWRVTDFVPLATALGYLGTEGHDVQLRMTALDGSWSADGVYVDPYRR
jgi:hypothetical protein